MSRLFSLVLCFVLSGFYALAQENIHLSNHAMFKPSVEDRTSNGLYGIGLHQTEIAEFNDYNIGYQAQNSFSIDEERSIDLLLESVHRSGDMHQLNKNLYLIANKYFLNKDYKSAIAYFSRIELTDSTSLRFQEVEFKKGYSTLTNKSFFQAQEHFYNAEPINGKYRNDAIYYGAICDYYLGDDESAVRSFLQIENDKKYAHLIPYYIAQIHFKKKEYDEVIRYTEEKLASRNIYNKAQVNRILGLSHLAQGNDRQALPYLDAYAQEATSITENELFQIASLNYKLGNPDKAVPYLVELSPQNSEIGQKSNYILGSICLNKGEKRNALAAFKSAHKTSYDSKIYEESQFLYYKLSADLQEERVAIAGLSRIPESSPYYAESQSILSYIFANTNDYEAAMLGIEELPSKNKEILNTYKQISFNKGIQELQDGEYSNAVVTLNNSLNTPGNEQTSNKTQYWLGYSYDKLGESEKAEQYLDAYTGTGDTEYRFETNYLKAYQRISDRDFNKAQVHLEKAIDAYDASSDDMNLLNDAVVRMADLELIDNNYDNAISFYDIAIDNDAPESDYILLQKSLIYGVQKNYYQKLTSLEGLLKTYPDSDYADDAYFEIAETLVALEKNNEAYQIYNTIPTKYGRESQFAASAYLRMGLLSYNSGDMSKALEAYKEGLSLSKDKEEKRQALIAIEEIYINELNDPEGFFAFSEDTGGLKINDYAKDSITYSIAWSAYKKSQYEKAIDKFGSYLSAFPNGYKKSEAHYYTAESYSLINQYSRALDNYDKVLAYEDSKLYDSALRKAALIAYNHSQDFDKAYTYYDRIIESSSAPDNDHMEAALYSAFKSDNTDGIMKYGEKIVELPDVSTHTKGTAHYYMAKIFHNRNEIENAKVSYAQVIEHLDNHQASEAGYNLSKLYYDEGDIESAETQAYTTTQNSGNYPIWTSKSLILIGDILTQKKDYLNASAAYETVIENFIDLTDIIKQAEEKLATLNKTIEEESRIETQEENTDLFIKETQE